MDELGIGHQMEYQNGRVLTMNFTAASAPTLPVSSASTASTSAVSASARRAPTLVSSRYGIPTYAHNHHAPLRKICAHHE